MNVSVGVLWLGGCMDVSVRDRWLGSCMDGYV